MIFALAVKFLPHNDCAIEMAEKINTFNVERILYILFIKLVRSDLFQHDTLLYAIIMYITRQKCRITFPTVSVSKYLLILLFIWN